MYRRFGKRLFDLAFSLALLLVIWPVLAVTAVLVVCKLGRPVLFSQPRPGLGGRIFRLYKFRSMTNAQDEAGRLCPDEMRLTPFGKWLRALSLDELPELWNILKGEMSLVGPRPLLPEYLPLYNAAQKRRHEVRPGLTGLAQVRGRNALAWPRRFKLDVWYIEHLGLGLDLKILILTGASLFKRSGIHSPPSATMEPFAGNRDQER